jgi:SAM-dependent methyltransferase
MKAATITPYDGQFYESQVSSSLTSARAVMPTVLDLIRPRSIVDFGCGRGTWLKACWEAGVETVLGLDGDYVDRETLLIEREDFQAVDLELPIHLDRRFDLAMCLEVGEHLPSRSARALVDSLAAAAPVVLFSAALPGQGGTHHVNEQWPLYWERLFAAKGMRKCDVLRPLIWRERSISDCYRQNLYLFAADGGFHNLDSMEQFEPDFVLVTNNVMARATFGWSSRTLKYLPIIRAAQSILSRLIP